MIVTSLVPYTRIFIRIHIVTRCRRQASSHNDRDDAWIIHWLYNVPLTASCMCQCWATSAVDECHRGRVVSSRACLGTLNCWRTSSKMHSDYDLSAGKSQPFGPGIIKMHIIILIGPYVHSKITHVEPSSFSFIDVLAHIHPRIERSRESENSSAIENLNKMTFTQRTHTRTRTSTTVTTFPHMCASRLIQHSHFTLILVLQLK